MKRCSIVIVVLIMALCIGCPASANNVAFKTTTTKTVKKVKYKKKAKKTKVVKSCKVKSRIINTSLSTQLSDTKKYNYSYRIQTRTIKRIKYTKGSRTARVVTVTQKNILPIWICLLRKPLLQRIMHLIIWE